MNARRIILVLGVILAAFLLLQPVASAQSQYATLSGVVRDPSGAVVSGAKVTVKSTTSGELRDSATNDEGFFSVVNLPAGSYNVSVEIQGFQTWQGKNIALNSSDSRSINIELKVGKVTDVVVVEGTTTEIAAVDSGEKSGIITQKDLEQLSLVSRNASEFVKLMPGALLTPTGGQNKSNYSGQVVGINGFVPNGQSAGGLGAVNINGQAANITQDGQNVFDPGAAGSATPVNPNPDMISEVKVLTSNFSAENAQGPVVVNTVTKGGTSSFHGDGHIYIRNSAMNATDHYNKESLICTGGSCAYPSGYNPKPDSSYYYPGGSIGGPLYIPHTNFNKSRTKLFFFEAYENYHQTEDAGVEKSFVPTADMYNGDFSALATYGSLVGRSQGAVPVQPNGTNWTANGMNYIAANRGTCTITGGVLSSACIDPKMVSLLKDFFPAANIPLSEIGSTGGFNYIQNFSAPQNGWQNVARGDWVISDNTKVYVTYSHQQESATMPFGLWNAAGSWAVPSPSPVVGANSSDLVVASFVHVFSPTMTSETTFGYTLVKFPTTPTDPAKISRTDVGFTVPSIFGNPMVPALTSWSTGIPTIGDIGHDYHPVMIANKGIPSVSENLTKVLGTHTAKVGFFFQHIYNTQDNWGQYTGTYTPEPASWGGSATGSNYADMLMGIAADYGETALPPPTSVANNIAAIYVQDSWKATRRLTLQYGLRFEHYGKPYSPVDNVGLAIFDPTKFVAGVSQPNNGVTWHKLTPSIPLSGATSTFLFYSPRLGAAYDLFGNGRTIIRGGWGMYRAYDSLQSNNYTGPAGTAFGSVGYGCNHGDVACASYETISNYAVTSPISYGASPLAGGTQSITTYDPRNHEQPLVYSYSVNIDQQLPDKFRAEFSYVGNKGTDFQNSVQFNAVPFGAMYNAMTAHPAQCTTTNSGVVSDNIASSACELLYRPYNPYTSISQSVTAGKSRFDSFQATVSRAYGWLTMQGNYTWSKTLAGTQNSGNGYLTGALPGYGVNWIYGVSNLDRPQAFSASYVFTIPGVKGGNSFVRGATNGWQISGVTIVQSGQQLLNSSSSGNRNFNISQGGTNQDAVHLLGSPDITMFPAILCNPAAGKRGPNQFVDPSCFGPQPVGKLGNAAMPYMGGPMYWNSDLSLIKNFKIKERQNLQFRVAAFNFLNHGLLSFDNNDNNLTMQFNDLGQVVTGASMLYRGNGLPAGTTGATTDQVMSCQQNTIGQTINGVAYPNGIKCAGTTTFGVATHHVGYRLMEFGLKYSF
jgi:hypothetical protein